MTCPHMHFDDQDPVVRELGLGAAALRYASMGLSVLPADRGRKPPHRILAPHGHLDASADPGQIARWWGSDKASNVAVVTGARSSLIVLDLDRHNCDGPSELWRAMSSWGVSLPATAWAVTPSNGVHLWFRTRASARSVQSALPGVDIKAEGGYVVSPPSMLLVSPLARSAERSEGQVPVPYTWAGETCPCQAAEAPGWLIQWASTARSVIGTGQDGSGEDDLPDLDGLCKTGVEIGRRNDLLYRLACRELRKRGTSVGAAREVRALIERVWRAGDTSGMSAGELDTIMASAQRFIAARVAEDGRRVEQWLSRMSR